MAVGIVSEQIAVLEPEDAADAELVLQHFLDGGLVQPGIARRRQQAALGGEQGAAAVDFDGAALQHEVHRFHRGIPGAEGDQPPGEGVVALGGKLAAPAVESEIQVQQLAVAHHGDRAVIAGPDVVVGNGVNLQPIIRHSGGHQPGRQARGVLGDVDVQVFVAADGHRNGHEILFHRLEMAREITVPARPGEHHGGLWRPLGRQEYGRHDVDSLNGQAAVCRREFAAG